MMTSPARLREMVGEATALPWCADPFQPDYPNDGVPIIGLRLNGDGKPLVTPTNGIVAAACLLPIEIDALDASRAEANAAFIVAAVNALPHLLDEIEGRDRRIVELEADGVHQAKLLTRFRHTLLRINDRIEDEGDRVFFGSTNDADDFREIVKKVDAFGWDQIIDRAKGRDVWAEMRELRQRAEAAEARIAELERERDRLQSKVDAFTNCDTFLYLRPEDQDKAAAELSDADMVKWVRWALVESAKHFPDKSDRSAMEVLSMHSVINLATLVHASNATKATFSVDGARWKGVPDGGDWTVTIARSDAPPAARAALERRS